MPHKSSYAGVFITLEGGEGTGKSTQIDLLKDRLERENLKVIATREPGGTPGAEAIREVILSGAAEQFGPEYEAGLFAAARLDHVENLIAPNLQAGTIVLCDRFIDSTRVYQGVTGKVDMEYLYALEKLVCGEFFPNRTIILDIDPEEGMRRAFERRNESTEADRFEKENLNIQQKRREAFISIAKGEPERCAIIDATGSAEEVHEKIWENINSLITSIAREQHGK